MSAESNNFESLRKLLAVKRMEVPPPGYFDQFAGEVRARLRDGEHQRDDLWRDLGDEASWLQRLWYLFSNRPALAGACGMAVCGLVLTAGIYYSQGGDTDLASQTAAPSGLGLASQPVPSQPLALGAGQPAVASSTNAAMSALPPAGLFDHVTGQAAEVNFSPVTGQ
jgi:hypothetical protein